MGSILMNVHSKLQIRCPAHLNTMMGKCLSLKQEEGILMLNQASIYQLETCFMALKDTSNLKMKKPDRGKLSVNGKKNHLQVQKKMHLQGIRNRILLPEAAAVITSPIFWMQYVREKTRPLTAIS